MEYLFLELSWRNRHCFCLFPCNQPHLSPNWEALATLFELIVVLKKINSYSFWLSTIWIILSGWELIHCAKLLWRRDLATFYFGYILYEMCGVIGTRYIDFALGWCAPVINVSPGIWNQNRGFSQTQMPPSSLNSRYPAPWYTTMSNRYKNTGSQCYFQWLIHFRDLRTCFYLKQNICRMLLEGARSHFTV